MKKYFLTICAVVKNEYPYLLEWIAFHKLQGVEHFYIYDNGSTDGSYKLLEELERRGVVTLYNWKDIRPVQLRAYNDCLNRNRENSEWICFLDLDEFLYSRSLPDIKDYIKTLLFTVGPNICVIAARWFMFGSNGLKEKDQRLVIERFTKRQADYNLHVKSIVKTDCAISTGKDPHTFYIEKDYIAIDDRGTVLPKDYSLTQNKGVNHLRINHYHTKSHEEYLERKKLGDPQTLVVHEGQRLEEMFTAHDRNEVEDTFVKDRYVDFVKTMIIRDLI